MVVSRCFPISENKKPRRIGGVSLNGAYWVQTACTSCTSGQKCRSKFSMPWRRVAVSSGSPSRRRACANRRHRRGSRESDVAAVLSHSRAHARLEQFLDGGDDRLVLRVVGRHAGVVIGGLRHNRRARHEVLHDGAKDHRLQVLPLRLALGHRDEVGAQEHAPHALDVEQARSERRRQRLALVGEVGSAVGEHGLSGDELQRRRDWGSPRSG